MLGVEPPLVVYILGSWLKDEPCEAVWAASPLKAGFLHPLPGGIPLPGCHLGWVPGSLVPLPMLVWLPGLGLLWVESLQGSGPLVEWWPC